MAPLHTTSGGPHWQSNAQGGSDSRSVKLTRHHLLDLTPESFEELVAKLWHSMGYRVVQTRLSADGGVDVFALSPGIPEFLVAIQAKRYAIGNSVGVRRIREYASLVLRREADKQADAALARTIDRVVIATTSSFTSAAIVEAEDMGVHLMDGAKLLELLNKHGPFEDVLPIEQLRSTLISRTAASFSVFGGHLRDLRGMQHLPQWAVRLLWHSEGFLGAMILIGILGRLPLLAFAALPFFLVGLVVGLLNRLYGRAAEASESHTVSEKNGSRETFTPGHKAPSRNLRFGLASLGVSVFLFAIGVGLRSFPAIALALPFWLIAAYLYTPASRGIQPR